VYLSCSRGCNSFCIHHLHVVVHVVTTNTSIFSLRTDISYFFASLHIYFRSTPVMSSTHPSDGSAQDKVPTIHRGDKTVAMRGPPPRKKVAFGISTPQPGNASHSGPRVSNLNSYLLCITHHFFHCN
jgi:hypothetical protein